MEDETYVDIFDIENMKFLGTINVNDKSALKIKYDKWRLQGYGVLIDNMKSICLDKEDSDDDGKYYDEQVDELEDFNNEVVNYDEMELEVWDEEEISPFQHKINQAEKNKNNISNR